MLVLPALEVPLRNRSGAVISFGWSKLEANRAGYQPAAVSELVQAMDVSCLGDILDLGLDHDLPGNAKAVDHDAVALSEKCL